MKDVQILSTHQGFFVIFNDRAALDRTIAHLRGMLEWTDQHEIKPPYLYSLFDDSIPKEQVEATLDELKDRLR